MFDPKRPLHRFLTQLKGGMTIASETSQLLALLQNDSSNATELERLLRTIDTVRSMSLATLGPSGPSDVAPIVREWAAFNTSINKIKANSSKVFLSQNSTDIARIDDKMQEGVPASLLACSR